MKKILIIASFLIFLIAASISWHYYYKPVESTRNLNAESRAEAIAIVNDFSNDEQKANDQYLNKVIVVSGDIVEIEQSSGHATLFLDGGDLLKRVACEMESGEHLDDVSIGDRVFVKGICTGFLMDVVFTRCILEKE